MFIFSGPGFLRVREGIASLRSALKDISVAVTEFPNQGIMVTVTEISLTDFKIIGHAECTGN